MIGNGVQGGGSSPFLNPEHFLKELRSRNPCVPAIDRPVRRLTLEVTKYCSVGCSFCKYNAPIPKNGIKKPELFLGTDAIAECVAFIATEGVEEVVLTGGGEPTHELATVLRTIREAPAKLFSLYTAGQWATTDGSAQQLLEQLHEAATHSKSPAARVRIRLSVDTFHGARIGTAPIVRILRIYQRLRDRLSRIDVYLRTVVHYDAPVQSIAGELGAHLEVVDLHKSHLILGDGTKLDILSLNLIPMGRLRPSASHRLQALRVTLSGLRRHFGEGWPLVYSGGLNIGVRPSGRIYLYASTPEDLGRIPTARLAEVVRTIVAEPISVALFHDGLLTFFDALVTCDPAIGVAAEVHKDPPLLVPSSCSAPETLLLAKLVALLLLARRFRSAADVLADLGLSQLTEGGTERRLGHLKKLYERR